MVVEMVMVVMMVMVMVMVVMMVTVSDPGEGIGNSGEVARGDECSS